MVVELSQLFLRSPVLLRMKGYPVKVWGEKGERRLLGVPELKFHGQEEFNNEPPPDPQYSPVLGWAVPLSFV